MPKEFRIEDFKDEIIKSYEDYEDFDFSEEEVEEDDGRFSITDLSFYEKEDKEAIIAAMRYLNYGDKTEGQLVKNLEKKEFKEESILAAVEYVKHFHYIDDERYAKHFYELHKDKKSQMRIRQDLLKRLIPEDIISSLFEDSDSEENAVKKDFDKILKKYDDDYEFSYEEKQKIMAKLYRKGYKSESIRKVFKF